MIKNETIGSDFRIDVGRGVDIRAICDLRSGAENFVRDFYFDGLNVLHCSEGRYKVECKGRPAVCLGPGELLITYPGHRVTIDALGKSNRLVYGVFVGERVTDYFDALGCFDGMQGKALLRHECIANLRALMKPSLYQTPTGHDSCIGYLSDLMVSVVSDVRSSGNVLVFDAVKQIRKNLSRGVVRLQDLCEDLKVCRSYLHRVFREAGLGGVAEFIKKEQLHRALLMLRNTNRSIAEIAKDSGFISVTHFSTFVKKRIGCSPRDLRR